MAARWGDENSRVRLLQVNRPSQTGPHLTIRGLGDASRTVVRGHRGGVGRGCNGTRRRSVSTRGWGDDNARALRSGPLKTAACLATRGWGDVSQAGLEQGNPIVRAGTSAGCPCRCDLLAADLVYHMLKHVRRRRQVRRTTMPFGEEVRRLALPKRLGYTCTLSTLPRADGQW